MERSDHKRRARPDVKVAVALFLTFVGLYGVFAPGHFYLLDASFKLAWAENVVNKGQLYFDESQIGDRNRIGTYFYPGRDGHLYIHFPLGGVFCFIPPVWLANGVQTLFKGLADEPVSRAFCAANNIPYAAASVVLAFLLARALGLERRRAAGGAVLFGVATPLFPYAGYDFNEPVAACFILLALYLIITGWDRRGVGRAVGAGVATGVAFVIRYELLAFAAATLLLWAALAAFKRASWKQLLFYAAPFAAVAAVVPAYNWYARGAANNFAYNTLPFFSNLIKVRFKPLEKGGPHLFVLRFIWVYFLSPNLHNVLLYCPFVVFGAAATRRLMKDHGPRALFLTVPALALGAAVVAASYSTWAWGLRYAFVFWIIAAAPAFLVRWQRWVKALFVLAIVWGVTLSVIATSADFQLTQNDMAAEILGDPSQVNYRGWLPVGRTDPHYSQIGWQFTYAVEAWGRTADYYLHGGRFFWYAVPAWAGYDPERLLLDIWPVCATVSGGVPARVVWPPFFLMILGTIIAARWSLRLVRDNP